MARPLESSPLADVVRRVDATADGAPPPDTIATGFPSIDRLLGGGLRRGDLVVLGGDVGSGKSALALAIALRTAEESRTTAFFGGEMTVDRMFERALAIEGRARIDDLRRGTIDDHTRAAVGAAAHRLQRTAPLVHALPAGGIERLGEELHRTLDLELGIVDPLQALSSGARPAAEETADAIRRLKRLAVELDVALLVTSGLPALSPDRVNPRPVLDDFGALGAIKQHADVVLALFREEMYAADGAEGATELLALKNRNGPTGYVDLYFYKQWIRFEDMLDPDR
jgi:replicative DNA helicase